MVGRKKGKNPRKRSMKALRRKRLKSHKRKSSGWKIKQFPELFKVIDYFPYIVRRDDERYK